MNFINRQLAKQLKRPSGFFGKIVADKMQQRNYSTYDWMLSLMEFPDEGTVLEIGYGTGKVLIEISEKHPSLKLNGIDFSQVMFGLANKNAEHLIKAGRLNLSYGDVLKYSTKEKFNVIYGINVIYFWDNLVPYFEKVHSLLRPDGVAYFYATDSDVLRNMPATNTDIFNKHSIDDIKKAAMDSCFKDIDIVSGIRESRKGHCIKLIA